jgi:hypothetical protein
MARADLSTIDDEKEGNGRRYLPNMSCPQLNREECIPVHRGSWWEPESLDLDQGWRIMGFPRDKDGILNSLGDAMRCFAEREWENGQDRRS